MNRKFRALVVLTTSICLSTISGARDAEIGASPPTIALKKESDYFGFFGKAPPALKIKTIEYDDSAINSKIGLISVADFEEWFGKSALSGYLRLASEYSNKKESLNEGIDHAKGIIMVTPDATTEKGTLRLSKKLLEFLSRVEKPGKNGGLAFIPSHEILSAASSITFNVQIQSTQTEPISVFSKVLTHQIVKKFQYLPLTSEMNGAVSLVFGKEELGDVNGIDRICLTLTGLSDYARCIGQGTRCVFQNISEDLSVKFLSYQNPENLSFKSLIQSPQLKLSDFPDSSVPRREKLDAILTKEILRQLVTEGANQVQLGGPQITELNLDFASLGIGGLDNQLDEIVGAILSRTVSQEQLDKIGLEGHQKGILLSGPPGTGKTLIARELAKMLNVDDDRFTVISGPEILNSYVGQSEANLRAPFEAAERDPNHLHVIFFDEIDSIAGSRTEGGGTGARISNNLVNQLLTMMDGVKKRNNFLVIGATNRPELLDSALMRPGRFNTKLHIGLPDELGRRQIFKIHLAKTSMSENIDIVVEVLAKQTQNFTGAEIKGICDAAKLNALREAIPDPTKVDKKVDESKLVVTMSHFQNALHKIMPAFGQNLGALEHQLPEHGIELPTQGIIVDKILSRIENLRQGKVFSTLISGDNNSGKSAVAAIFADKISSQFDFTRVISPSVSKKGFADQLEQAWQDSRAVESALIILDGLEHLTSILSEFKYDERSMRLLNTILNTRIANKTAVLITMGSRTKELFDRINQSISWSLEVMVTPITKEDRYAIIEHFKCKDPGYSLLEKPFYQGLIVNNALGDVLEVLSIGGVNAWTDAFWKQKFARFGFSSPKRMQNLQQFSDEESDPEFDALLKDQ